MGTTEDLGFSVDFGALPATMMREGEHYRLSVMMHGPFKATYIATDEATGFWAMATPEELIYVNPAHVLFARPETIGF
jgi:hypothetical protein